MCVIGYNMENLLPDEVKKIHSFLSFYYASTLRYEPFGGEGGGGGQPEFGTLHIYRSVCCIGSHMYEYFEWTETNINYLIIFAKDRLHRTAPHCIFPNTLLLSIRITQIEKAFLRRPRARSIWVGGWDCVCGRVFVIIYMWGEWRASYGKQSVKAQFITQRNDLLY